MFDLVELINWEVAKVARCSYPILGVVHSGTLLVFLFEDTLRSLAKSLASPGGRPRADTANCVSRNELARCRIDCKLSLLNVGVICRIGRTTETWLL